MAHPEAKAANAEIAKSLSPNFRAARPRVDIRVLKAFRALARNSTIGWEYNQDFLHATTRIVGRLGGMAFRAPSFQVVEPFGGSNRLAASGQEEPFPAQRLSGREGSS